MPSPGYWREIPQRYRLEAGRCKKCGHILFPPRLICPKCGFEEFDVVRLPDRGRIVTYTIIRVPPTKFSDEAPYAIGIVELEGGVRLTAQIVDIDLEELKIDMPVKLEFRKIQEEGASGILCYGYKAVPDYF